MHIFNGGLYIHWGWIALAATFGCFFGVAIMALMNAASWSDDPKEAG